MVEDNPNQNELEELAAFCKKFPNIYIYEHESTQRLISKYLHFAQIKIQGFVKPEVSDCDRAGEPFPVINLLQLKEKNQQGARIGVIISTDSAMYNQDVSLIKEASGVDNFYFVSEWNKRTIPYKMMPRSKENFWVEVNLADHCNLNCQCCDHFSPIAKPTYLDFDQYVKDLKRLSELTDNKIGLIKLQGGEPLLNDRLIDFMRVTRQVFPNAFLCLFTDGVLLKKWGSKQGEENFWKTVKEYEYEVRWTHYPIGLNIDAVKEKALSYGVEWWENPPPFKKGARCWLFSEIGALSYKGVKHSVKHPFWLEGGIEPFRWISCYQFNESIVLRDGKIYTCPMIPYAHYFNEYFKENLEVKDDCFIDIYKAKSYEEIAEFCTHRTSFCNYCAVHHRSARDWCQSKHTLEEWTEEKPECGDFIPDFTISKKKGIFRKITDSLKNDGVFKTGKKCVKKVLGK